MDPKPPNLLANHISVISFVLLHCCMDLQLFDTWCQVEIDTEL